MKKTTLLIVFNIAILLFAFAQDAAQKWKLPLKGKVLWQKVTPFGTLVVSTSDYLIGIDPEKGTIAWQLDAFANTPEERYQVVPNTPYVALVTDGKNPEHVIIDVSTGKILCNSKEEGILGVFNRTILSGSGNILIYGINGKLQGLLVLFDVKTGKKIWEVNNPFGKGLFGIAKIETNIINDKGFILFGTTKEIFKIDEKTGNLAWKTEVQSPKGFTMVTNTTPKIIISAAEPVIYFTKDNFIAAHDINTGKPVWADIPKLNGPVDKIIYQQQGFIMTNAVDPNNNMNPFRINLYNYKTGKGVWDEKGIKMDGALYQYKFWKDGLVIAMESKKGRYYINQINLSNGQMKFKNSLKVDGELKNMYMVPKGLMYITSNQIDIIDVESGKTIFPTSIEAKKDGSLLTAIKGDFLYAYSTTDKLIYEINSVKGEYRQLTPQEINIEGKKEIVETFELRPNGLAAISNQNINLYDFTGKELYHTYVPAPEISRLAKIYYSTAAFVGEFNKAASEADAAKIQTYANQEEAGFGKDLLNAVAQAEKAKAQQYGSMAAEAKARLRKRFEATASAGNFIFMLTTLENKSLGLSKTYGIVKVNKADGKIVQKISFDKDKEPKYEIDDLAGLIFYASPDKEIICFKF